MNRRRDTLAGAAAALALAVSVSGQVATVEQFDVRLDIDSGPVTNTTDRRSVVFSEVISVPEAAWLRLAFDRVVLGATEAGGGPTVVRITSLLDGAVQTLDETHVEEWKQTSAYFNGGMLLLQIVADPGAEASRIVCTRAVAGPLEPVGVDSICDVVDDRVLADDRRVGRTQPGFCTAFIIDDANHCLLTAGHCAASVEVMEFNVPLSAANGSIIHPGPEDQYAVDETSVQTNGGQGLGNDWAYFGCFPNAVTGLTPFEAQGEFFTLAASAPPVGGQLIRITGYGTTSPPVPDTWNYAQKTHTGPYLERTGTIVRYRTDSTGGNSGSPVIDETTGEVIGVHTNGGCRPGGVGSNAGTAIENAELQAALRSPLGVCQVNGACCFPGGTCFETSQGECEAAFGVFQGALTTCATVQCTLPCPADVTGDGTVDVLDLLEVLMAWGPCPGCPADVTGDGTVDVLDLLEVLMAWGPCP